MTYAELLREHAALRKTVGDRPRKQIAVLGNVVVAPLKPILEHALFTAGINAEVVFGDYDNLLQSAAQFSASDAVLVFWELANLCDGLPYRAEFLSPPERSALLEHTGKQIASLHQALAATPLVLWNCFSPHMATPLPGLAAFHDLSGQLNQHLASLRSPNVFPFDVNEIYLTLGRSHSFDLRNFYYYRAPYSIEFFKLYAGQASRMLLNHWGGRRKVLVLDADHTLWKGIVGEDGVGGIAVEEPYREVQGIAKALKQHGVLLALCSRNNREDVEAAFLQRQEMVLSLEDFAFLRINWENKTDNLRSIAQEANLGLDSFVFLDDSPYECEQVRQVLPEVTVVSVPDQKWQYPAIVRRAAAVFGLDHATTTAEDLNRTKMLQTQKMRAEQAAAFVDEEAYLRSLGLQVTVYVNKPEQAVRIAQLTQKTNQFNLTTLRLTTNEVEMLMARPDVRVFSWDVCDSFGSYGLVGVCIVEIRNAEADLLVLLQSCRVLGRKIERKVMRSLLQRLCGEGLSIINGEYRPTQKNPQVAAFYPDLGFRLIQESPDGQRYAITSAQVAQIPEVDFIALRDE